MSLFREGLGKGELKAVREGRWAMKGRGQIENDVGKSLLTWRTVQKESEVTQALVNLGFACFSLLKTHR